MNDTTPQMKLEVVLVPVADVDRAKEFYSERLGFTVDHDTRVSEELRIVQLTPPGSACSVVVGSGLTEMPPGSLEGLQLVVSDIEEARHALGDRGVAPSEVELVGPPDKDGSKFVRFSDPDGNQWALQELRGSFAS